MNRWPCSGLTAAVSADPPAAPPAGAAGIAQSSLCTLNNKPEDSMQQKFSFVEFVLLFLSDTSCSFFYRGNFQMNN